MATCTIQPPALPGSASGAACTASSWSRASTGSMVSRSSARRSVRPASFGGSSVSTSASTASGNSSGMPCACTAIRLILRWSCGLPSVSTTRACGTPKRPERARSKRTRSPSLASPSSPGAIGHSFSSLRSTGSMTPPPLARGAEDAELAPLLLRQALDGLGLVAVAGDVRVLEPRDAGQDAVALAERRLAGAPAEPRAASTSTRGRSPSLASHTAGSAISSPSASRATISSTATGGSLPALLEALAVAGAAGPRRPSRPAAA